MPTALITGITGQDGSHLAELLLSKGYRVYGMVRRSSTENFQRLEHIRDRVELMQGDLLDHTSVVQYFRAGSARRDLQPRGHVVRADQLAAAGADGRVHRPGRDAHAGRRSGKFARKARFYQASSSEMFGKVRETPQRETTPFYPRSPYGVAKVYGHFITVNYRESYGICSPAPASFSTTKARAAAWSSSRARSATPSPASSWAWPTNCAWAICRPSATGALPAITCGPCGSCCSRTGRRFRRRHRRDAQRRGIRQIAFDRVGLDWQQICRRRSASSTARPRSICCWPIRQGQRVLGWEPEVSFDNWCT